MKTKPNLEQRRRLGLTIERLHRTANTAAEVLAGGYSQDTIEYLLGCATNLKAEVSELVDRSTTR